MQAKDLINTVVNLAVKAPAKAAGFKKAGLNFYRRRGEVVHVVNFQLSHGNFADEGRFYVNVGVSFDPLWGLAGKPAPDRPKEYQCQFRRRLENLVDGTAEAYEVSATTDLEGLAGEIGGHFQRLVSELDRIDSLRSFLAHRWLKQGNHRVLAARLHYVLGELDAAEAELQRAVEFFADRGLTAGELIEEYRLVDLRRTT